MKKLAVFTLLAIFLFNTVGYYIAFKVSQSEAQSEIKAKIKSSLPLEQLTAIILKNDNIENIQWIKKDKEFYYNNKLYDIVKTEVSDKATTFYCLSDEKEETLFANLDEHVKNHIAANNGNNKSNSSSKKIMDHVVKIYFSYDITIRFHTSDAAYKFSNLILNYRSEYSETNSPPPKFI